MGGRRRHGRPWRRRSRQQRAVVGAERRSSALELGRRTSRAIRGSHHPRQRRSARARQIAGERGHRHDDRRHPHPRRPLRLRLVRRQPRLPLARRRAHADLARSFGSAGPRRPRHPASRPKPSTGRAATSSRARSASPIRRRSRSRDGAVRGGDRFLLCSDGLTNHVDDSEIAALLAGRQSEKACARLIALTLAARRVRQCLDRRRRLRLRHADRSRRAALARRRERDGRSGQGDRRLDWDWPIGGRQLWTVEILK